MQCALGFANSVAFSQRLRHRWSGIRRTVSSKSEGHQPLHLRCLGRPAYPPGASVDATAAEACKVQPEQRRLQHFTAKANGLACSITVYAALVFGATELTAATPTPAELQAPTTSVHAVWEREPVQSVFVADENVQDERARYTSSRARETPTQVSSLQELIDAATRCREALELLRGSLPVVETAAPQPQQQQQRRRQPTATASPDQQRDQIEAFRLSLRRVPLSETRRKFFDLARMLDKLDANTASATQPGMESYRKVVRALEELDGCALQATRTRGLERAEKLLTLRQELYDRVLQAMDQMLARAHQLALERRS
jgi:hypothetical protein